MNEPVILTGDCRDVLPTLPAGSVHCCVTSPPYFGLRSYGGGEAEVGREQTPADYVATMVEVFRSVRRVLRDDGTLWLNLGDSYSSGGRTSYDDDDKLPARGNRSRPAMAGGLKPKDLIGIPWRVAFALQDDGWYLRSAITWAKRAPMPESVRDRPTSATEMVFLLAKSPRYYYDADAVRVPNADQRPYPTWEERKAAGEPIRKGDPAETGYVNRSAGVGANPTGRNLWNYWTEPDDLTDFWLLGPEPFPGAHFAVMPSKLAEPCVRAGCPPGGTVLDPFAGAGTTLMVARRLGRASVGVELNPDYIPIMRARLDADWKKHRPPEHEQPALALDFG